MSKAKITPPTKKAVVSGRLNNSVVRIASRIPAPISRNITIQKLIKNFLFPKLKCSSSRYFYQVLWQFLLVRRSRDFGILRDENRPNYFKNRPHFRKPQGFGSRPASLGCQFVLNFGRKKQLAILHFGKRKMLIKTI